ncbi:MAG: hypothetical protein LC633_06175 [Desulfobulbaceae bacterium]|nr:hypothetical protein [Desulfobulbaceae bacterium]
MAISDPLNIIAIIFALLALIFFIKMIGGIRKGRLLSSSTCGLTALLLLTSAALFATISIATHGYQALTREELAATVNIEPSGNQQFKARVILADGSEQSFILAGDQFYVDAHILKWKPLANIFGLHTSYELDRVGGRYVTLQDEITRERTVYSLSRNKPLNMYDLRRRFAVLAPLLDTDYGSATFINSNRPEEYRLLVSTTGLLIRKSDNQPD